MDYCMKQKIPVGYTPGVLTDATADLTIGLMLAVNRQLMSAAEDARSGRWKMWYSSRWLGMGLNGATLGIIGMGKIGSAVARRAKAFGMEIIFTNRSEKSEVEKELNARQVDLTELLASSDIISLHAPLTRDTENIINSDSLRKMKKSAVLINTARGKEVDTDALFLALRNGWISGAGLDVTFPEPLPSGHPLYGLENCVILPHIGSATLQARQHMAEMTCLNLLAGLESKKLPYCANPTVYQLNSED